MTRSLNCAFILTVLASSFSFSARPASAQTTPAQGSLLENLSFFVGPDGSKQPQDLGINANMGIRVAASIGLPLVRSAGLGLEAGVALNASDAAVHVLDQVEGTSSRRQTFVTLGVFQRPSDRFTWGLAYDMLDEHYYDDFVLGQVRGTAAYRVTADNEVGAWFTASAKKADALMGGTPVHLEPITQVNVFTRHTWANMAQTSVWLGVAREHGNVVWVFPDNSVSTNVVVYGAELSMPLSDRFAITGSANLITPTSTGTVDAFLGVSFYPKRSAMRQPKNTFAPVHSVANNPSMAIDLQR